MEHVLLTKFGHEYGRVLRKNELGLSLTRREFLALAGGMITMAILTACTPKSPIEPAALIPTTVKEIWDADDIPGSQKTAEGMVNIFCKKVDCDLSSLQWPPIIDLQPKRNTPQGDASSWASAGLTTDRKKIIHVWKEGFNHPYKGLVTHELGHLFYETEKEMSYEIIKKILMINLLSAEHNNPNAKLIVRGFSVEIDDGTGLKIYPATPLDEAAADWFENYVTGEHGTYRSSSDFLEWVNNLPSSNISSRSFINYHRTSDVFGYMEQITGRKLDSVGLILFNEIIAKIQHSDDIPKEKMPQVFQDYFIQFITKYSKYQQFFKPTQFTKQMSFSIPANKS